VGLITVAGGKDIPLAIPAPQTPSGDPQGVASEVYDTLFRDLEISGFFTVIDPNAYIEQGKGVEPGTFEFKDWSFLKVSVLVKTRFLPAGDTSCHPAAKKTCADVFVYYVVSGDTLLKKRFRAEGRSARHMGHAMANAVILSVTGRKGIFGGQIAAVGSQSGNKEIYVLDLGGRGVTNVTRNGSINLSPSWSPDGRSLAWTSYKKSNPDLYVKNLGSGHTRVISNQRGINTSPAFSPDGKHIALTRSTDGDSDLYIVDAQTGTQLSRVTKGGGIDVSPHYSPDGTKMAFASERSGGSQVYLQDLASGDAKRITFVGDFNTDPVISPDGTKLAFVGRSPGGFDIFVCDIDGSRPIRITQDMGDNEDPSWSPDSAYLIFSSTRNGRSEIWLSTADGRHQVPITRSGGWTQPTWSPIQP
jgi:TolB protein